MASPPILLKDYGNDPFVLNKKGAAKALLEKYSFSKEFNSKRKELFESALIFCYDKSKGTLGEDLFYEVSPGSQLDPEYSDHVTEFHP